MSSSVISELSAEHHPFVKRVGSLPQLPGVYLMKDERSEVIYIGKARNLRARIRGYFSGTDGRAQIGILVSRLKHIDTIVTESEHQAFVLERDLIARYKPRYNIKLKDDKAFLNIRIDLNAAWPRLELVRRVQDDGATYFGPYSLSYELKSLLELVRQVVPLRTCTDTVFHNRQRPCLEYQIKRCAGPCCLPVDRGEYHGWVQQAIELLEGRALGLATELTRQMERASEDLRFEDAAQLRDRIDLLSRTKESQVFQTGTRDDRDVFGFYREAALAVVSMLRIRQGRILDTINFSLSEVHISDEEVLEGVLSQCYEGGREVPPEVMLPFELENTSIIEQALSTKAEYQVLFERPQRGVKFRLIQLAQLNARQYFVASYEQEAVNLDISKELARTLKLKQIPRRIECVDISNLQASDIVGAIVVYFDGIPDKSSYKRYHISFQDKPDDFAAMHEVVSRRLRRGMQDGDLPDLLIIDGGVGQLRKAIQAREELKLSLEIISLAKMRSAGKRRGFNKVAPKKPERVYTELSQAPLLLDRMHPVTHFLQRMRDEAHRFVISFHRQRRAKRVVHSLLDEIPGLGPYRKQRLLKKYGSITRMRSASAADLSKAGRMPLPLAQKLLKLVK